VTDELHQRSTPPCCSKARLCTAVSDEPVAVLARDLVADEEAALVHAAVDGVASLRR